MMPMLRHLLSATCRGIERYQPLPAIVRERLVRFRHSVRVFALLDRTATQVARVEQFVRELLFHRLAVAASAGVADDPADAQREAAVRIDFDRHLIVRAADAARLHFERRLRVVDRLLEDLHRIVAGLLFDDVEAAVQDALGGAALAVRHHRADELGDQRAVVQRIRQDVALGNFSSTWHGSLSALQTPGYDFGRLAPYFDRPCLRPWTPTASSVPRTT